MTPEQMQKEMQESMQRMADRLVQAGFARYHISHDALNVGQFDWTGDGLVLQGYMKKLFDIPKVRPQDIAGIDIVALTHLLLGSKPV